MNTKNLVRKVSSLALNGALLTATLLPFTSFASPVVAANPKLQITDVVDKQLADRGETLSYTITLSNTGDVDLTTTYLKIDQPNLADYVAGSSNYTRSTNSINHTLTDAWITDGVNFGTVPANSTVVLKYQTTVAANANTDDIVWSNAAAKADQVSQVNANSWTRVLLKTPNICAAKTADKSTVSVGDTVTFTIKVCNTGNVVLHNVRVGDIIHLPFRYVAGSTNVTLSGRTTHFEDSWLTDGANLGDLNPGQDEFMTYQVTIVDGLTDGQNLTNTAQVKSDETPIILQCSVTLKGKVLGIVVTPTPVPTPKTPTELPNTGPGDVLLIAGALAPAGFLLRKFRTKI